MSDIGLFAGGVALSITISTFNSIGMGLQKRVHKKLAVSGDQQLKYYQDRSWVIGLICMTIASVGSLGNYALLGQSRASAMASITIVTNAIMAKYFLGEIIRLFDVLVIGVIMTGVTVAVVFGSTAGGAPRTALDDIIVLLSRNIVYEAVAVIFVYAIAAESFVRYQEKRGKAGLKTAVEARLECFMRAFTAGLFSGSTGFFAKAVVVSIENMAATHSPSDLLKWQFWLFLIGLPSSIVLQLRALNSGLKHFDATEVVPIYQSSIIFWGVMSGWVFYNENENLTELAEGMFALGCSVSVGGILLLLTKKKQVTQGNTPPSMADNERLAALDGKYLKLEEGPDDVVVEPIGSGKAASPVEGFPTMAPYPGAPALLTSPTNGPASPSFSVKGAKGPGRSGAGERTPLTGARSGPSTGAVFPVAGASSIEEPLAEIKRTLTRNPTVAMLLQPAASTGTRGDSSEMVRRRADTATAALLNALDAYAPSIGSAITGEQGPNSATGIGSFDAADAAPSRFESISRGLRDIASGRMSRSGSIDIANASKQSPNASSPSV